MEGKVESVPEADFDPTADVNHEKEPSTLDISSIDDSNDVLNSEDS